MKHFRGRKNKTRRTYIAKNKEILDTESQIKIMLQWEN